MVMAMHPLTALRPLALIVALSAPLLLAACADPPGSGAADPIASPYFEPFHGPACAPGTGPSAICPGD
jgi:hypothetical protein